MPTRSPSRYFPLLLLLLLLLIGFATSVGSLQSTVGLPFASRSNKKPYPGIERLYPGDLAGIYIRRDRLPDRAKQYTRVNKRFTIGKLKQLPDRTPDEKAAWKTLDRAAQMWHNGHRLPAVRLWRQIVTTQPGTEVSFDAQFNIAEAARYWGDYPAAIRELTCLLDTPPSSSRERERSDWPIQANKHHVCKMLSDHYLECANLPGALKYANLALRDHPTDGPCGYCNDMEEQSLQDHIARLKAEITNSSLTISSN